MQNKIGEKIRELRKKSDITQEKLANHLGISFQAISRWESGNSYPDLEMLPALANYFNVTADELLGVDITRKAEKVQEIHDLLFENFQKGLFEENIKILRAAINEYPNEYSLLEQLAYFLSFSNNAPREYMDEAISIYERIQADCPDLQLKLQIIQSLAYCYVAVGERDKALELAAQLPHMSQGELMVQLQTGEEKLESLHYAVTAGSEKLAENIIIIVQVKYATDAKKRIEAYHKAVHIYETVFECGDFAFYNLRLHELHMHIAAAYIDLQNHTAALDAIEKAADYAIAYDNLLLFTHTSLLLAGYEFTNEGIVKGSPSTTCYDMLHDNGISSLQHTIYDPLRDTPRFAEVIRKLEAVIH